MEKILAHYWLHQIHPCWEVTSLFSIVTSPIEMAWFCGDDTDWEAHPIRLTATKPQSVGSDTINAR
jgi:hypothetical protein